MSHWHPECFTAQPIKSVQGWHELSTEQQEAILLPDTKHIPLDPEDARIRTDELKLNLKVTKAAAKEAAKEKRALAREKKLLLKAAAAEKKMAASEKKRLLKAEAAEKKRLLKAEAAEKKRLLKAAAESTAEQ